MNKKSVGEKGIYLRRPRAASIAAIYGQCVRGRARRAKGDWEGKVNVEVTLIIAQVQLHSMQQAPQRPSPNSTSAGLHFPNYPKQPHHRTPSPK